MKVAAAAALVAALAVPASMVASPAVALETQASCADAAHGLVVNSSRVGLILGVGDQVIVSTGVIIGTPIGPGPFSTDFTATVVGIHSFHAGSSPFTITCTAFVVPPASPASDTNSTAPLPAQTLWQTAQHRDDTQQRGIQNAISGRFSGGTGGSAGATDNSLNFVSSFAALGTGSTASDIASGSLDRLPSGSLDGTMDARWNAWVSGRVDFYRGDNNGADGTMGTGVLGLDYLITDDIVLGGFAGYNVSDFDINPTSTVESGAFSIGSYAGFNFADVVVAELFAAYTFLDYDVNANGVTGSFDADAVALGLSLYGNVPLQGGFTLEPTVRAKYNGEAHDAYVDSASNPVGAQSFNSLRFSAGGRLYYDGLVVTGGTIRPWVGALYEYAMTDTATQDDVGYLETSLGLISTFDRVLFELSADVGGIGSGAYIRYGGDARLGIRF